MADASKQVRSTSINFRLTDEVRSEIDTWAEGEGRTRSDMARILIDEALKARAKRLKRNGGLSPSHT